MATTTHTFVRTSMFETTTPNHSSTIKMGSYAVQEMPRTLRAAGDDCDVRDIGGKRIDAEIRQRLKSSFLESKLRGERVILPDELLYDDRGLQIWNEIIYLPEYYQTHDETAIFKMHGQNIASLIPNGANLIDLGAGDSRKVSHLLSALEKAHKNPAYYALDISNSCLKTNVGALAQKHPSIHCTGLWGTFTDGTKWIESLASPRVFVSLGSVICNDEWNTALRYLRSWASILRPNDLILIGMDGHEQPEHHNKVHRSYHPSPNGQNGDIFANFWRNGFEHANRLVGETWFREQDWQVAGAVEHKPSTSHRFVFQAKRDFQLGSTGVKFRKGDEIDWFDAHKWGEKNVRTMCTLAGLDVIKAWKAPASEMRSYLVKRGDSGKISQLSNGAVNGADDLYDFRFGNSQCGHNTKL